MRPPGPCSTCGKVHERCAAHRKSDGQPCGRWPKKGLPVCRQCGGAASQVQAAADRRAAQGQARALAREIGVPVEHDPTDGILQEIYISWGTVLFYRAQVQALDPDALIWGVTGKRYGEGPEGPIDVTDESAAAAVWLKLWNEERDRHAALCVQAVKIGLDERRIRLEEKQAELLASNVQWLLSEARMRLDLTEAGQSALSDLVREMLQRMAAQDEAIPSRR